MDLIICPARIRQRHPKQSCWLSITDRTLTVEWEIEVVISDPGFDRFRAICRRRWEKVIGKVFSVAFNPPILQVSFGFFEE